MNTKIITVPGAEIKLTGNTVRDLIAALEQVDPDARTSIGSVRTVDGTLKHISHGYRQLQLKRSIYWYWSEN